MSHLFRALSVAALASSSAIAIAQQPLTQPGQIQPAQPGQVQPVQPGQNQAVRPGQIPGQPGQPGQVGQNQGGMQAQGISLTSFIAHELKRGNEAEVELGQMASERAKTDSVKQFAQMMVKEHQQVIQQLEQFDRGVGGGHGAGATRDATSNGPDSARPRPNNPNAPDAGVNPRENNGAVDGARNNVRNSESNTDDNPRASDRSPTTGGSQASSSSGAAQGTANPNQAVQNGAGRNVGQSEPNRGGLNQQQGQPGQAHMGGMSGHVPHMLVAIHDQACDNELQLTKEMLQKHEGEDFEMAYIGQQIVAHTCMLAKLQALKNSGPQELQQLVAKGEQSTRQHLDQAMKIAHELGGDKK